MGGQASELHYTQVTSQKGAEDWARAAAQGSQASDLYSSRTASAELHVQKCRVKKEGFALRQRWEEMRSPSMEGSSSAGPNWQRAATGTSDPAVKWDLRSLHNLTSAGQLNHALVGVLSHGLHRTPQITLLSWQKPPAHLVPCQIHPHQYLQWEVWINSPRGRTCTKDHFMWTEATSWQQKSQIKRERALAVNLQHLNRRLQCSEHPQRLLVY